MKRAQGLPISTIVIAAISVLVLIMLIIFFTGGFSKIFKQTNTVTNIVEADITAAQTKCTTWCSQAQNLDADGQKKSSYCTRAQGIDINGDGTKLDTGSDEAGLTNSCKQANDNDDYLCCNQAPINTPCSGVSCT